MAQYPATKKRTICHIEISAEMNQEGIIVQQLGTSTNEINLLKN